MHRVNHVNVYLEWDYVNRRYVRKSIVGFLDTERMNECLFSFAAGCSWVGILDDGSFCRNKFIRV